jgi:ATP-dependent helicase/nuclease subunit B
MLETRTIDFKNITLTSANEGLLPGSKLSNSFLPADIRSNFGLPGYQEKNAIFAYHFYRLLQRSENAWLIFNTESDEMGGGEKSRFIAQLLQELPAYNPQVNIQQRTAEIPIAKPTADFKISIGKSPAILQRLAERATDPAGGFSPSRLNIFLTCPLQFYFSEILGIKEPDEVDDTIDAMQLGTVVHQVLERLFRPFIGKDIDPGYYKVMKSQAENHVELTFKAVMPDYDFSAGKNALLVQVAKRLVLNYLTAESGFVTAQAKEHKGIRILALEHKMRSCIDVDGPVGGAVPGKIYLNGTADRIDVVGDIIRIIDYKTGSVQENSLRLASPEALLESKKQGMSFQLLMYAFLLSEDNSNLKTEGQVVESGIASLRSFNQGLLKVTIDGRSQLMKEDLQAMKAVLRTILLRLFDTEEPFAQTSDTDSCKYCTFKSICNR